MKRLAMVTAVSTGSTLAVAIFLAASADGAAPQPLWSPRDKGIAASANADASRAAAEVLAKGGNAIDGAVAAALALGVVDPESSGLGGGGFAVVWSAKDKKAHVLDFRETAPAKATRDMFLVDGKPDANKSKWGGLAVAVPGEPAGLAEMEAKYGKLGLSAAAQPAIRLARNGFLASRHLYDAASAQVPKKPPIGFIPPPPVDPKDPLAVLLSPGGQPLVERERVRRPELAKTIEAFAHRGPAAFYQGPIGAQLVKAIAEQGGILTAADLRDYKPLWKEALHGQFRGNDVWATPAPGGGVTALETLNILDARPPLTSLGRGSSAADHVVVEALKHAFADRARSLGDPAFVQVPTERLLSTAYAKELAARIHDDKVGKPESYGDKNLVPPEPAHDGGTSHLCVADGEGNVVSMTSTVNLYFGARFSAGTTGVVLNDEMDDFSAQPGVPNAFGLIGAFANAIAPGKRPTSSTTPMILTRDGEPVLCVGAAGGPTIISATVQAIVNVIDFGLDVQAAVNAPRVHAQWMPDVTAVEVDVSHDVQEALTKRGHKVKEVETLAAAQAIGFGPKRLTAASDPRYGGVPAAP